MESYELQIGTKMHFYSERIVWHYIPVLKALSIDDINFPEQ